MRQTAEASEVRQAYVWYTMLSADALHTSATSLDRHLFREFEGNTVYLRVDVAPEARPEEIYETVEILCSVVLGVCVASNEILGGTPVGVVLRSMADEFDSLKAAHAGEDCPGPPSDIGFRESRILRRPDKSQLSQREVL